MDNINKAIDALHNAFVGGPASEAGDIDGFGAPPVRLQLVAGPERPQSLEESALESVCNTTGSSEAVRGRMEATHKIQPAYHAPILADAVRRGFIDLEHGCWMMTEAGIALAVERGWLSEESAKAEPVAEQLPAPTVEPVITEAHREVITDERAAKLLGATVLSLRSFIAGHDSIEDLRVLHRIESAGKARKTVLASLEARGAGVQEEEDLDIDPATVAVIVEGPDSGMVVVADTTGDDSAADPDETPDGIEPADELVVVVPAAPGDVERAIRAVPVVQETEARLRYLEGAVRELEAKCAAQDETLARLAALVAKLTAEPAAKPAKVKAVRTPVAQTGGDKVALADMQEGQTFLYAGKVAVKGSGKGTFRFWDGNAWMPFNRGSWRAYPLFTGDLTDAQADSLPAR
jgi:uncharacterized coiled-coil protein SlyX